MGKKAKRSAPAKKASVKLKIKNVAPKKKVVKKALPKKAVRKVAPKKAVKKALPKKAVPAKRPKAVKAVPAGPKGYTPAEYQRFKEFKQKFSEKTNQELKDLLRKNMQSMSGNKDELIYKCADGATLGRIPRCPNCFGGR